MYARLSPWPPLNYETIHTLTGKATDSMVTSEALTPAAAATEATRSVSVSASYVSMPRSRDRQPFVNDAVMANVASCNGRWPMPNREREGDASACMRSHHAAALSPVTGDANIAAAKDTAKSTIYEIDSG